MYIVNQPASFQKVSKMTSSVIAIILLCFNHGLAMDVSGKTVKGPQAFGQASDGLVSIAAGGKLSQSCNLKPPHECGAITGDIMSGLYIGDQAELNQEAETNLICGNYTVVTLDKNCELNMRYQSQLRPNVDYGGGRIEVYCSAVWTLGQSSYINLDRQSKVLVQAQFTIGKYVMIRMEPASTLEIGNSLELEDLVFLILNQNSKFQINPTSGGAATISSSNLFTPTTVTLDPSAFLLVNGTFIVGNGRKVTMTIADSGSLIITSRGQFSVQATTFEIGPSSFWLINGEFTIDKSSTFASGMQSNLTIDGTMETSAGSLTVAPFSSFVIQGTCTNKGNITTSEFTRLVIGPTTSGTQGTVTAQSGGSLYLGRWSTMEVFGYLVTESSTLSLGERATVTTSKTSEIDQSANSAITLGHGASLDVAGQFRTEGGTMELQTQASASIQAQMTQNTGSRITLGEEADATFQGEFTMNAGSSMTLAEGAEIMFAASVEFQKSGAMTLAKGAFLTISGQTEISGGSLNLEQQSIVTLAGQTNLFSRANVTIGEHSMLVIPSSTIVNVSPGESIVIGERSKVTFSPKMYCTLMTDFVVGSYTQMTVTPNSVGISCYGQ